MPSPLVYEEASIFIVPLEDGGYARGVVARTSIKGGAFFGYFFGPKFNDVAEVMLNSLEPEKAILRERCSDMGLRSGTWKVVGKVSDWKRLDWVMPNFVRRDPLGRLKPRLVKYSDTDPTQVIEERVIESDSGLPAATLAGVGWMEGRLSELLKS